MESAMMEAGFLTDMCGSRWENIFSPGISPEDEVEITLANPHRYGNRNAYRYFFSNLYIGPDNDQVMAGYLEPFGRPLRIAGLIAIITAFMLIGAAAAASAARFSRALSIWEYGAMTFFAGAYTILDTVDISLVSSRIIFNTYGKCLCIMLFTLMLGFAAAGRLTGKKKNCSNSFVYKRRSGRNDNRTFLHRCIGDLRYVSSVGSFAGGYQPYHVVLQCMAVQADGGKGKTVSVIIGSAVRGHNAGPGRSRSQYVLTFHYNQNYFWSAASGTHLQNYCKYNFELSDGVQG